MFFRTDSYEFLRVSKGTKMDLRNPSPNIIVQHVVYERYEFRFYMTPHHVHKIRDYAAMLSIVAKEPINVITVR